MQYYKKEVSGAMKRPVFCTRLLALMKYRWVVFRGSVDNRYLCNARS